MTLSEDDLIATLFAPLAGPGAYALMDDAATIQVAAGQDLVVTKDALVAGVHFFPDDPAGSIAAKALGVNLSDLAAKGAAPAGFLLALALPSDSHDPWLRAFAAGLGEAAAVHGCPLLGGDTVRTPGPLTLSITAFGTVPHGRMVPRTGAQAGDRLYVSGTIGDAALGLALRLGRNCPGLGDAERDHLLDRYLHPRPRLGLRAALQASAHAAMDVSDGLVGDLRKMLRASGVGGAVDLDRVPLSAAACAAIAAVPELWVTAMTGGDDYEVLASVPPAAAGAFEQAAAAAGVPVTCVGDVRNGDTVRFTRAGEPVELPGGAFQHF